jgi:hypothetical protein
MSLSINNSFLCPPCTGDHYPTPPPSLVLPAIPFLPNKPSYVDPINSTLHAIPASISGSWSTSTSPITTSSWSSSEYSPSTRDSPNRLSSPDSKSPAISAISRHKLQKRSPHIAHPYARLEAKKNQQELGIKRRKVWDHMLEKRIFSVEEL